MFVSHQSYHITYHRSDLVEGHIVVEGSHAQVKSTYLRVCENMKNPRTDCRYTVRLVTV